MSEAPGRTDLALAAATAAVAFAIQSLRFPELIFFWDEFQLAYGVLEFDLSRHQPHPPGYLFFVWLGRLLLPLAGDPALALRWVAAAACAAFAGLAVGRRPAGLDGIAAAGFALACGVFALGSPLVGRFGRLGLSYTAEGALFCAWLLAFASRPRGRRLALLVGVAGLSGGLRPHLPLWTGACLAWAAFAPGAWIPRRRLPVLAGAFGVGLALWIVPLLWESGGLAAWREASGALTVGNVLAKSVFVRGFEGFLDQRLSPMLADLVRGVGLLALCSALVLVRRVRRGEAALVRLDPLLAGAALAFGFYALLLYDTRGYLVSAAMPLALYGLRGAALAAASADRSRALATAAAVLVASALVALGPDGLAPGERFDVHDARLRQRFAAVRRALPPDATVLVTSQEYRDYGLRHVGHYLPEYPTLQLIRDDYFAIVSDAKPFLVSEGRALRAAGPARLDLANLAPHARLAHVVYMLPPGDDGSITPSCAPLTRPLDVGNGETLQRLRVEPNWRVFAYRGQLHCEASGD